MRCQRVTDPAVFAAGTFTGTRLDPFTGSLANQGTPALVADVSATAGATTQYCNQAGTFAGSWTATTSMLLFPIPSGGATGPVMTVTAGSSWSLTTSAYALDIRATATPNGGIVHVAVDGQPRGAFDTSNAGGTLYRVYLDGLAHTVKFSYQGEATMGAALVSLPADLSGTAGLAAALTAVRNGLAVTTQTWKVYGQAGSAANVYSQTLLAAPAGAPGGTPSTTGGSIPAGGHTYLTTIVTVSGETAAGTASGTVTTTGATSSVALTGIATGPSDTLSRKVYRADGGAYGLVLTVAGNATTTGTDTAASRGAAPPSPGTALALAGSLVAGTTSDALVAGVSLTLKAGAWDTTSVAQFTTTAAAVTITTYTTYANLAAVATYATPVFDSGEWGTAWPLWEFVEGPLGATVPTLQVGMGDNPTPDTSWTWSAPAPVVTADSAGNNWQRVVVSPPPFAADGTPLRGRYAQLVGSLPVTSRVWASDFRVFRWRPESDPFVARLDQAQREATRHPVGYALTAAIAALAAYLDQQADDALAGTSIATSGGAYLANWGQQLQMPRLPAEPDANYRARLQMMFAVAGRGGSRAGSQPFLQAILSGAFGCSVAVFPRSRGGTTFLFGVATLGTTPLGRSSFGTWRWTVRIPLALMAVPPETATTIINSVRPLGSIVTVQYT